MRMIGIGLMAFIIAWAVFLLSSHNVAKRGIQQFNELAFGPQLWFEVSSPYPKVSNLGQKEEVFFGTTSQSPIILTGIPAYQGAVFSMPIDARPLSGYLQIDMTSQVLSGVKGAVRVSIGNTKRGEILLYPGEAGRSLRIPLHPQELLKERLVVSFSMLGSHPSQTCSSQDGIAAIVEIETTSGLYLELDRAVTSPRDRVLAMGRIIPIAWNQNKQLKDQIELIQQASAFIKRGETVVFHESAQVGALNQSDLLALNGTLGHRADVIKTFPHPIAVKGANFGSRSFYESTNWRIRYHPREFENQSLPSALDLKLTMSTLLDRAFWTVTVTLNGTIVHSETLTRTANSFGKTIALPSDLQTISNVIEVSLQSSKDNIGLCNDGPKLVAQLDRSAVLIGGDQQLNDPLYTLQEALGSVSTLAVVGTPKLSQNQALFLSEMISHVAPPNVGLAWQKGEGEIEVLQRSEFRQLNDRVSTNHRQWIVMREDGGAVIAKRVGPSAPRFGDTINAPNAVLVSLPISEDAS